MRVRTEKPVEWSVEHREHGRVVVRAPDRVGATMAASMIWRVDWLRLGMECDVRRTEQRGARL